ncbi:hypothetical protein [Geobacillus stearothermophilus]|uniref:hypothetical protein n=1 Tax=Geobacillus stearothermophilus TaxID=1422 RepID=UPI000B92B3AB|nr:hypothetical protein GLN3_11420 [Geobacillus lituanicus]
MAKKAKVQHVKSLMLTYTGVVEKASSEDISGLYQLMRKFESARRFSRERIFEGWDRKETTELTSQLFIPNKRYMRDAFSEAEANIASLRENLPRYVEQEKDNIKNTLKRIKQLKKEMERHIKNKQFQLAQYKEQIIQHKQAKLKKHEKSLRYYRHHMDNGTVPKVVDGSKKLLQALNKGKITKQEWKEARSNNLYSRGERSKGGNENIKFSHLKDNLFEMKVLNPLSGIRGNRLHFIVRFPDKFAAFIASYLETGEAYSVRIKRQNGKILVHFTVEHDIVAKPDFSKGVAGMDINPDNLAVTIVYPNGNFKASKVFWMHDVNTVRAEKRDTIIQNTLYEVVYWMKSFGVDTLVIEDLNFLQTNKGSAFNRIASNFSYSNMIKSLLSVAYKENIALVQVDAYYSSFIGKVKYQQMYGLSVHQSAAFVLARRGMGLKEKMPKNLLPVLFAKEAKKGQEVSDLFKHWKKAKAWYDDLLKQLRNNGIRPNGLLFSQILRIRERIDAEESLPFEMTEHPIFS